MLASFPPICERPREQTRAQEKRRETEQPRDVEREQSADQARRNQSPWRHARFQRQKHRRDADQRDADMTASALRTGTIAKTSIVSRCPPQFGKGCQTNLEDASKRRVRALNRARFARCRDGPGRLASENR